MSTPPHPSEPSPRRSGPSAAVIVVGTVALVGAILVFALSQNQGTPEHATIPGGVVRPAEPPAVANTPAPAPAANAPAANQPGSHPAPPLKKPEKIATTTPTAPPVKPKVNPSDLPPDHPPIAADEKAQVGIQWFGHSCFYIHSPGGVAVVTDPFDPKATGLPSPGTGAHFVTVSTQSPRNSYIQAVHPFKDETTLQPLPLDIVRTQPAGKDDLRIQPVPTASGTMYVIQAGALRIAHLGGITQPPTAAEIKALGKVDLLMIPVGEGLKPKQAVAITKAIAPSIVLPMAYSTPDMEGPEARLRPVEEFIAASPYAVTRKDTDVIMVAPSDLPASPEIYLLRLRG